ECPAGLVQEPSDVAGQDVLVPVIDDGLSTLSTEVVDDVRLWAGMQTGLGLLTRTTQPIGEDHPIARSRGRCPAHLPIPYRRHQVLNRRRVDAGTAVVGTLDDVGRVYRDQSLLADAWCSLSDRLWHWSRVRLSGSKLYYSMSELGHRRLRLRRDLRNGYRPAGAESDVDRDPLFRALLQSDLNSLAPPRPAPGVVLDVEAPGRHAMVSIGNLKPSEAGVRCFAHLPRDFVGVDLAVGPPPTQHRSTSARRTHKRPQVSTSDGRPTAATSLGGKR